MQRNKYNTSSLRDKSVWQRPQKSTAKPTNDEKHYTCKCNVTSDKRIAYSSAHFGRAYSCHVVSVNYILSQFTCTFTNTTCNINSSSRIGKRRSISNIHKISRNLHTKFDRYTLCLKNNTFDTAEHLLIPSQLIDFTWNLRKSNNG